MSKILVVDDDKSILHVYRRVLLRYGYSVEVAESYKEASKLAESACFDAAILDTVLPDGSGVDLAVRLTTDRAKVLRIIVTGSLSRLEEAKNLEVGDAYFLKPVDPSKLLETIKNNLKA